MKDPLTLVRVKKQFLKNLRSQKFQEKLFSVLQRSLSPDKGPESLAERLRVKQSRLLSTSHAVHWDNVSSELPSARVNNRYGTAAEAQLECSERVI